MVPRVFFLSPRPGVLSDPAVACPCLVAACPCPFWSTCVDGCPNPVSRGTFSFRFCRSFLKRHYVLIEFLFFRSIFCFSVLDVTSLVFFCTVFGEGKRETPPQTMELWLVDLLEMELLLSVGSGQQIHSFPILFDRMRMTAITSVQNTAMQIDNIVGQ